MIAVGDHCSFSVQALLEHFHFPLWSAVAADPELRDAVEFVVVDDASPANQSLREFLFRDGVNIPAVRAQFLEMQTRIGFNIAGTAVHDCQCTKKPGSIGLS